MPSDLLRRSRLAAGLGGLLLVFLACGEDSGDEDRTAPPAPRMRDLNCVETGAVLPETGVDADGSAGFGIRLEWDMAEEPADLNGFLVYRAPHPDSLFAELPLDPERFLEGRPDYYHFVDQDPVVRPTSFWGERFWYYVRAIDGDGNASAPSDTVTYRLWASPRVLESQVAVQDDTLHVAWQYEFVDYFALGFRGFRVLVADPAGTLVWSEDVLFNLEPQMSAAWPVTELGLAPGSYSLRIDTVIDRVAQVDSLLVEVPSNPNDCPLSGSESYWISFTF